MTMMYAKRLGRAAKWLLTGSAAQRRRVRQELARASAAIFGDFPISEDHKLWRDDKAFLDDFSRMSPGNPYSQDRKWTLREYVKVSNTLQGDLAECGCHVGTSAFFIAQASSHGKLYLFDSFQGLSAPDETDLDVAESVMPWSKGGGDMTASEATLRHNLSRYDSIAILPGWIPERFAEIADHQFRLVHVDVDLYQPTRDSLIFFYPRLVKGGIIVMDDYGFKTCPGATRAADELAASEGFQILHLATGQGVIMKR
ncbi:TylF/MycF/NovP-related O-methyltransferase [Dyella sp. EPa41]|uniref:TylF/MycF/NovP-related O-methyltransferase n=1 Tax=Dyella sp. EPa41 TaxID=1561194 RepID=UPI0019151C72|nr:TylF/MycF/NovP-related O-methyltransferase [Dyella sp. EPa41]